MIFDTTNQVVLATKALPKCEGEIFAITLIAQKIYTLARLNKAGANPQPLGLGNYDWSQAIQAAALQLGDFLGERLNSYKKIESEAWALIAEAEEAGPDSFISAPALSLSVDQPIYAKVNLSGGAWAAFKDANLEMEFCSANIDPYFNTTLDAKKHELPSVWIILQQNNETIKNVFSFRFIRGGIYVKARHPYKFEELSKADTVRKESVKNWKKQNQNHG